MNEKGERFVNKLREWLEVNKKDVRFLEEADSNESLDQVFLDEYMDSIIQIACSEEITGFVKSILCSLLMAQEGKLYGHIKAGLDSHEEEEVSLQKYFDLNDKSKDKGSLRDLEWTGWLTKNLEEFNLIKKTNSDDRNNYFELTIQGEELIKKIVTYWKNKKPDIFDEVSEKNAQDLGFIKLITFHQSYSYEEFIEGIRPNLSDDESGDISYELSKGVFREISDRALYDTDNKYVLIIDEINRGNISKIFGELITLIEEDKRIKTDNKKEGLKVQLPYSKDLFGVPDNLYIIGTMNSSDKSITSIDIALRRRFLFREFMPKWDLPEIKDLTYQNQKISLKTILKKINERIEYLLDKDHLIGHSYFIPIDTWEDLCDLFNDKIIPLLQEYFHNDFEKIAMVFKDHNNFKSDDEKFIIKENYSIEDLFGGETPFDDEKDRYKINPELVKKKYSNIPIAFFIKGFLS